jgi:hypothetical protein
MARSRAIVACKPKEEKARRDTMMVVDAGEIDACARGDFLYLAQF